MATVEIGTGSQGLLLQSEAQIGVVPDSVTAVLRNDGLDATVLVYLGYSSGFRDLAQFFDRIARDWKGWREVRAWESVEGDLRIEARHSFGHVQLRVTLRKFESDPGNEGWKVTADLTLDPGEQVTQIASVLAHLARGET